MGIWVSKNIYKKDNRFYLDNYKYLGKVEKGIFVIHTKKPDIHFYIKGRGYPINEELLKVLRRGGVKDILIPEEGKTGFRIYLGNVEEYLNGERIEEPHTEPQRVIPLERLEKIKEEVRNR